MLSGGEYGIIEKVKVEKLNEPETTYNFEVEDFHTYYVGEQCVLVHNICAAKDDAYEARVNTSNEHGKPHAHILKEGRRIAKIDVNGTIVKGRLDKGGKIFVNEFWSKIFEAIVNYYPRK